MFQTNDFAGNAFDKAYVEQRSRNEPIVEITQIKGTSETHPTLSTRDEWAGLKLCPTEWQQRRLVNSKAPMCEKRC